VDCDADGAAETGGTERGGESGGRVRIWVAGQGGGRHCGEVVQEV
jgi:hypothetical protein